jgi:hypothetical protein
LGHRDVVWLRTFSPPSATETPTAPVDEAELLASGSKGDVLASTVRLLPQRHMPPRAKPVVLRHGNPPAPYLPQHPIGWPVGVLLGQP